MSTKIEKSALQVAATAPSKLVLLDEFSPEIVPSNKLCQFYLVEEGYELHPTFRTRSRDEAKDFARELRNQGKLTAYIALHQGWFGVFQKDAPQKPTKAAQLAKPEIPVEFEVEGFPALNFASTKEARNFAKLLVEAARQAEYDFDRAAALAAKEAATN